MRPSRPDAGDRAVTRPAVRRRRFILAAVGLGTVLALVAAECAVRALGWGPQVNPVYAENYRLSADPVLQYELVPGSPDGPDSINRHGMRDREYEPGKPEGVFRIALLGDSVAYGMGCRRAATFPKLLETLLNTYSPPSAPTFEVLNFAVTGYSAAQCAAVFHQRSLAFAPDLVVYAYVLNDPQPSSVELDSLRYMQKQAQDSLEAQLRRGLGRALMHSRLYQCLRRPAIPQVAAPDLRNDDPAFVAARGGELADYVRSLHQRPATWDPVARSFDNLARDAQAAQLPPPWIVILPMYSKSADYPLADVHEHVSEAARQRGLRVLDGRMAFDRVRRDQPEARLFGDILHLTPRGHQVAAIAILHALATSGDLPEGQAILDALQARPTLERQLAILVTSPDLPP